MKSIHWTQHWHHISASLRLAIISITGLLGFFLLSETTPITIRLAISWIIAGGLYLLLTYFMMYFSSKENISGLSKKEDDGAALILLITVLASIASLVAIVMILAGINAVSSVAARDRIAVVLATYATSWLLIHTSFSLHYAYVYYQEYEKSKQAPLVFAATLNPSYIDFLYFSIVIGMTCQTADVNLASSRMRYLVMIQGITAFIFNATLLALTMNMISGLIVFN
jgi:uncharacterized membrane protein